jgi:hypothetical protein
MVRSGGAGKPADYGPGTGDVGRPVIPAGRAGVFGSAKPAMMSQGKAGKRAIGRRTAAPSLAALVSMG